MRPVAGNDREAAAAALRAEKKGVMLKRRRSRGLTGTVASAAPADVPNCIAQIAWELHDEEEGEVRSAVRRVQVLLSRDDIPPIAAVLRAVPPVVPRLVQIVSTGRGPMKHEALWALTNIAAGTNQEVEVIVQAGGIPMLVSLLQNDTDHAILEQATWCIANACGDSARIRDMFLDAGVLTPLLNVLHNAVGSVSLTRTGTSAVCSLMRGKPFVRVRAALDAVPYLAQQAACPDSSTAAEALWGLSSVSDCRKYIQIVLQSGVLPCLVSRLSGRASLVKPAACVLGNIMAGTTAQTQAALDAGVVVGLSQLLSSREAGLPRTCLWALSNAAAGPCSQVQHLIDAGVIGLLLGKLEGCTCPIVSKEILWVLANAVESGTDEQHTDFVRDGLVPVFVKALQEPTVCKKASEVVFAALGTLLEHGSSEKGGSSAQTDPNPCVSAAIEAGIEEVFERLQDSPDANDIPSLPAVMELCSRQCVRG